MDSAKEFLGAQRRFSMGIAVGVMLCILSPVALMFLSGVAESGKGIVTENVATAIGITTLLLMVAVAVGIFIIAGVGTEKYEFIKKGQFQIDASGAEYVRQLQESNKMTFAIQITIGVILCIIGVVPIILAGALIKDIPENQWIFTTCVSVLLLIVSVGVFLFIIAGIREDSYKQLLKQEEYGMKRRNQLSEKVGGVYWPLVTAGYLA